MKEELQGCEVWFPDPIGKCSVIRVEVVGDRRLIVTLHAQTVREVVDRIGALSRLKCNAFSLTVSCFQGQQRTFGMCVLKRQRPFTGLLGRLVSRADGAAVEPEFAFKVYPTG